jgi:tetratricopeptide (TPR) repeat protein
MAGWEALVDGGRSDEAERLFDRRLRAVATDPVALFGRASIAYERGAPEQAIAGYAAVLAALHSRADGRGPLLAPMAAGRLLTLYDEVGAATRKRIVDGLRPVELARAADLPWQARVELARLAAHAAREAADATELARVAERVGCAAQVFDLGVVGPLPNIDLDAAPPAAWPPAASTWRPVLASGCRLDVAATADGRGGARLLRVAFEVPAGDYDVVLDYPAEARIAIDGGAPQAHGAATRYGPHLSAAHVRLQSGRHDLEVRLATRGGVARLSLAVLGSGGGGDASVNVRYVDPRSGGARRTPPAVVVDGGGGHPIAPRGAGDAAQALHDYCTAYAALRRDATDDALVQAERLRARPRFALGHALAAAIAREDTTRPMSFAQDGARSALRAAVSIDPSLARPWHELAAIALEADRPRDGIDAARAAARAAPGWWAPPLQLARAFTARGLDFDAAQALARGDNTPHDQIPCAVLDALRGQARERRELAREARLETALVACGGNVEARVERLRARGELAAARVALRAALVLEPGRQDLVTDLATVLAAEGNHAEAIAELAALAARDPNDPLHRVELADAQVAAGRAADARATITAALAARPDVPEVLRAARALAVALPLDEFRVDGRETIRAFEAVGSKYAAPAVMVLDRSVMRLFPGGTTMVLTHQIVRVDSKDAVARWGEVAVPSGAEILTLRTHKRDGSTREPEEINGKETISAADVAIGDYIEWEYLEARPPLQAFAPGFLTDRFFFQSFDAPMARSELVLVSPPGIELELDRRAGAPDPRTRTAVDGTRVTTFLAVGVQQLYAERAAVPAIEYVPSVRASSGVSWKRWARYLAEELHDAVRSSPDVRAQARKLAEAAPKDRRALAAAMVEWVTEHIEAGDELTDPAAFALARGRGSRIALTLALARELGIPARPVLARSLLIADPGAPLPPQELDDFADALVELDLGAPHGTVYVDPRLRHAAFGYLPPGLDGARILTVPDGQFALARKTSLSDGRNVDMVIRLDEQGGGTAVAVEQLAGWPALEWAEMVDRFGADRARLRQDFEQRWLGVQFPGAHLRDLDIELPGPTRDNKPGTARIRYTFSSTRLAVPSVRGGAGGDREMRMAPTFFRSQPGRRFAAEPQRATALMLGFDVPTSLRATVELPRGASVNPAALRRDVVISRAGGYHFVEERELRRGGGNPTAIVLRREAKLPIMRVTPEEYGAVAADLRRVDGAEQEEIRIPISGATARGVGR